MSHSQGHRSAVIAERTRVIQNDADFEGGNDGGFTGSDFDDGGFEAEQSGTRNMDLEERVTFQSIPFPGAG